jgi:hypothetical protein
MSSRLTTEAVGGTIMKCRIIGSIVVAVMLWTTSPQAQTKPNFAGQWTLVPDKTQSGGSGGCPAFARGLGGLAQEFTVTRSKGTGRQS